MISYPDFKPYKITTPNNMGVVRYILAISVFIAHFSELTGCNLYFPISSYSAVGGFFALSGFLIYGSYLRKPDLRSYIVSRAWRLLPAYWITVLFFAILLAAVSTLASIQYFTSSHFLKYLVANLSFLNFIEPSLPGVFQSGSVTDAVNGSLWTMKVEWCLYLSVPAVAWLISRFKISSIKTFVGIYIAACIYRIGFLELYDHTGKEIYALLSKQFFGQLSYFYSGVAIYFLLDKFLKYKWHILGFGVILLMGSYLIPYGQIILHPAALSIIVVWFSMVGKWGAWEGKHDNFSYNIYLIHFPVIQLITTQFPQSSHHNILILFLLSLFITLILSRLLVAIEKWISKRRSRKG